MKSKAQLIYFIDQWKVTKKMTWSIYRPDEKLKKYWKFGIELSINDKLKAIKYTLSLNLGAYQKKIMELTESTHII